MALKTMLILSFLTFMCPDPKLVNLTLNEWTKQDIATLKRAQLRCGELYPRSPCVRTFVKVKSGVYRVICKGNKKVEGLDKSFEIM